MEESRDQCELSKTQDCVAAGIQLEKMQWNVDGFVQALCGCSQ